MTRFDYVRAVSLDHAVSLINDTTYKSKLLAGGTDILVYLHHQQLNFNRVVDISLIPELKRIQCLGNEITLGAGVTFSEVIENKLLQDTVPFLVDACRTVGSPQIRNLGTLGGNVVNAAACADSLPVLVCLDAIAHLRGLKGDRAILVNKMVLGPNLIHLEPGELLTHFTFMVPPKGVKTAFIKLGRRNALAISRLTMASMGRLDASRCIDFIRIAPGAAIPRTSRFTQVEDMLLGNPCTSELIVYAAKLAAEVMIACSGWRWSTEFKGPVISTLVERALDQVFNS